MDFIRPRLVVLTDNISEQQWHEFSEAIRSLPIPPHVTLVKSFSVLPLQFYQLPQAFVFEEQSKQAALRELSKIDRLLGFATMNQLIPINQLEKSMRQWQKEKDQALIGKMTTANKTTFFRKLPAIVDMTKWLACFENGEKYPLKY